MRNYKKSQNLISICGIITMVTAVQPVYSSLEAMKKKLLAVLLIGLFMFGATGIANANIIWNWTFASEFGQFVTDSDIALPGTYTMLDFSVTASATGGTIGSLSGGNYSTGRKATDQPFTFIWDGSQVTQWLHSGGNLFDWWSFGDVAKPGQAYDFGWDTGNINDPDRAAHYDGTCGTPLVVGDVTVTPIPEPATIALMLIGSAAFLRKTRRSN